MTRLARDRDTHLTRKEIAAQALRCFDEADTAPSIRHLAAVLHVTPSAIYHHFPNRAAIIQAAVDLVWEESGIRFFELVPDPFTADPVDVLVTAGIVTRETFGGHYQVAPHMTATPQSSRPLATIMELMATVFERMGFDEDQAAAAFHLYASFTIGSALFAAARRITLALDGTGERSRAEPMVRQADHTDGDRAPASAIAEIRLALEQVIDLSIVDSERDAALFADGLRRLVSKAKPISSSR